MNTKVKYQLVNDDFPILDLCDCLERKPNRPGVISGIEAVMERDMSDYYFIDIQYQNQEKRLIAKEVWVNGVQAEFSNKMSGGYFIKKDLVKEPLIIEVKGVKARKVSFRNLERVYGLGLPGEMVNVHIWDDSLRKYATGFNTPDFTFYKEGTDEVVEVKKLKYSYSKIYSSISFIMPDCDLEGVVKSKRADNKAVLSVDESNIRDIEYSSVPNFNTNFFGIVSTALYSDDYDFGAVDHDFIEGKWIFKKDTELKVEVYLLKKVDITCELNGYSYKPVRHSIEHITGSDNVTTLVHAYRFHVVFKDDGVIKFKIND